MFLFFFLTWISDALQTLRMLEVLTSLMEDSADVATSFRQEMGTSLVISLLDAAPLRQSALQVLRVLLRDSREDLVCPCVCVCVLGEGCLRDTTQGRTFHVLIFLLLLCLHRWTGGYGAGSRVFANPPRLEGEEAVVLVPASSFQGELSNARLLSRE